MSKSSSLAGLARKNDRNADKAEGASGMSAWINELDNQESSEPDNEKTNGPDNQGHPLKRLNVDVPEWLHKALKRKALDDDTTVKHLVVSALEEAIGNDQK